MGTGGQRAIPLPAHSAETTIMKRIEGKRITLESTGNVNVFLGSGARLSQFGKH
jgi:hypothetical protein